MKDESKAVVGQPVPMVLADSVSALLETECTPANQPPIDGVPDSITESRPVDGVSSEEAKRPLSPQKIAANRSNAKRSTGPTSEAGKAKAAENSYKHGFFANRAFVNQAQLDKDKGPYEALLTGIQSHYEPVGYMENLWVERIALESLRYARLLEHEQRVLAWSSPFEERSATSLVRYQASVNRNLAGAIDMLEGLQNKRMAVELRDDEDPLGCTAKI